MKRIVLRNRFEGTTPLIVHANGVADSRIWSFIRDQFYQTAGKFSPTSDHAQQQSWTKELTVLTWNTGDKPGHMERSCRILGIPFNVIKAEVVNHKPNTRITYPIKIEATVEAMEHIKTPYVMLVDSWDAIFLDSPAKALEIFKRKMGTGVMFGAERGHFPGDLDTAEWEKKQANGKDRAFLNSGMVLGFTADVARMYQEAKTFGDRWDRNCLLTDQGAIKVWATENEVAYRLDHECRIVQNLFGVVPGELELLYADNGIRLETV